VEKKILDPIGTQTLTPRSSSPKPVAIPTTLSRVPIIELEGDKIETGGMSNEKHNVGFEVLTSSDYEQLYLLGYNTV
jgi:hypothetical protein